MRVEIFLFCLCGLPEGAEEADEEGEENKDHGIDGELLVSEISAPGNKIWRERKRKSERRNREKRNRNKKQ